jgi:hypothetical protein
VDKTQLEPIEQAVSNRRCKRYISNKVKGYTLKRL